MFLQENCSAVVKQLIKIYTHYIYIWHAICFCFFFLFEEQALIYQGSYCYQNVKHLNMWIVKWTANMWDATWSGEKYCSNHSICAQVCYCSFCTQASFVFDHISASLHLWELVAKSASDISLHFHPWSRNCLCSSVGRVAHLKPIFKCIFPQIQCLLISLFFCCISMSCIAPEGLLSALISLFLSHCRPSGSGSIDEYKCHLMSHQLDKKVVKRVRERR